MIHVCEDMSLLKSYTNLNSIATEDTLSKLLDKIPKSKMERPITMPPVKLPYPGVTYNIAFSTASVAVYMPRSKTFDVMMSAIREMREEGEEREREEEVSYGLTSKSEFMHAIDALNGDVSINQTDIYIIKYLDIPAVSWSATLDNFTVMFDSIGSVFHGILEVNKEIPLEKLKTTCQFDTVEMPSPDKGG